MAVRQCPDSAPLRSKDSFHLATPDASGDSHKNRRSMPTPLSTRWKKAKSCLCWSVGISSVGELSCLSKKCMPCVCSPERGWTISLFSLFQSLHSGSKTGERLNQQPTLGRQRKCKGPGHSVENTRRELTPAHSPASGPQPS